MTYSPTKRICSTIGAGGLNFCVRNGYRCDPSAIITRISFYLIQELSIAPSKLPQCITSLSLTLQPRNFLLSRLVKPSTY